jgi:5-methylcytosine-specific restriction enzyme A
MPEPTCNTFSVSEYVAALRRANLSPCEKEMLRSHYHAVDRTITAAKMSVRMGWKGKASNLHYGRLAKRVGLELGWKPLPSQSVFVLVTFDKPAKEWLWTLRTEAATALERLGLAGDGMTWLAEELPASEPIHEGARSTVLVKAFERNPVARERCVSHYGCRCAVCDVLLSNVYGDVAQGFIHVHHLKPVAEVKAEYQVDPINDLRPVCPNCHAVLHLRTPPFTIAEARKLIADGGRISPRPSPRR